MKTPDVNKSESLALYEQVAAEIRRSISDGEARPGERLPSAIDLAEVIGVNKNTVMRAFHILRDEGLLDFTRGRGIRVVASPEKSLLQTRINDLFEYARRQGYRREEVLAIIQAQA
jgi:DNA-binding transcriptional regulator YhcF (GntR family)